jgi:hypothetical protein
MSKSASKSGRRPTSAPARGGATQQQSSRKPNGKQGHQHHGRHAQHQKPAQGSGRHGSGRHGSGRKHNPKTGSSAFRFPNGAALARKLPKLPGGLSITSLAAAGGGAIVAKVIDNAVQIGAQGGWLELVKKIGIVALVATVWPESLDKKSATAGAAAVPVVEIVNKAFPNFMSRIQSWIPSFGQAPAPTPPPAQGTGGLVDTSPLLYGNRGPRNFSDAKSAGMGGLVSTQLGAPRSAPLYSRPR